MGAPLYSSRTSYDGSTTVACQISRTPQALEQSERRIAAFQAEQIRNAQERYEQQRHAQAEANRRREAEQRREEFLVQSPCASPTVQSATTAGCDGVPADVALGGGCHPSTYEYIGTAATPKFTPASDWTRGMGLLNIAAWPTSTLKSNRNDLPEGLLMPPNQRVSGGAPSVQPEKPPHGFSRRAISAHRAFGD
jgi:hypothetical protein